MTVSMCNWRIPKSLQNLLCVVIEYFLTKQQLLMITALVAYFVHNVFLDVSVRRWK